MTEKKRPPRVSYDAKKKRYFIKIKGKRVYLPKTIKSDKEAIHTSLRKLRYAPGINSIKLKPIAGYTRRITNNKNWDSPLVVSHTQSEGYLETMKKDIESRNKYAAFNKTEEELRAMKKAQEDLDKKTAEADALEKKLSMETIKKLLIEDAELERKKGAVKEEKKDVVEEKKDVVEEKKDERERIAGINAAIAELKTQLADLITMEEMGTPGLKAKIKGLRKIIADTEAHRERLLVHGAAVVVGHGAVANEIKRDGLYSNQIADMMEPYKDKGFIGVVSADELTHLIKPSTNYDKFGFIMNKDTSDKPGSHWVGVYVDCIDDLSVEYYDSFAEEPDELFQEQIKKLLDPRKLEVYLKFKVNKIKQQAANSSLCGFHAMRFLIDRFADKPWVECSGYSNVKEGEGAAEKLMKKYERFGYI